MFKALELMQTKSFETLINKYVELEKVADIDSYLKDMKVSSDSKIVTVNIYNCLKLPSKKKLSDIYKKWEEFNKDKNKSVFNIGYFKDNSDNSILLFLDDVVNTIERDRNNKPIIFFINMFMFAVYETDKRIPHFADISEIEKKCLENNIQIFFIS